VLPVVRRDHGEVAERVGGDEQSAVPEVHLVDAQGAGEVRAGPPPVGGAVELADLPIETVGEDAIRQFQEEVASHRLPHAVRA